MRCRRCYSDLPALPQRDQPVLREWLGHRLDVVPQDLSLPLAVPGDEIVDVDCVAHERARRTPEQVALAGSEAQVADNLELMGGLDTFGHDGRRGTIGELSQRSHDRQRRLPQDTALDQAEVDLDQVELDLAEETEAGVSRSDIIRGNPHPDLPASLQVEAEPQDVFDGLAFGELENEARRADAMAGEDRGQAGRAGFGGLGRPRRPGPPGGA